MDSTSQEAPALSLMSSIPRLTRFLAALFVLGTLLSQPSLLGNLVSDNFALLPMATIGASKVWNVVTAGFVELDPVKSAFNTLLFLTMGKWIETSWGARSFFAYLVVVNTLAGICTYVVLMAAFVLTRVDKFLFSPVGTTNGVCAALLVAVKQLIPEHEIGINGMNMSANYLPLTYVGVTAAFTVVGLISVGDLTFTLAAFQFAWLYLRYFQRRNGQHGDLSEAFTYSSMFPEPLRTVVAIFANFGFMLFKPVLLAGQSAEPESDPGQQMPVSKANSVDAERRRQRALQALDERMKSTANEEDDGENQV